MAAITPLGVCGKLVGVEGFEPPTTCAQGKRTTRLSNTPNEIAMLEILEIRWDVLELNQPSHPLSEGRHTSSLHPLSQVHCASPHDLPFVKGFTSEIEQVAGSVGHALVGLGRAVIPH